MIALLLGVALAASPRPVEEAERLAEAALQAAQARPAEALASARRALLLTAEFDPVAFVAAGRKGEVVEDEFRSARQAYRRHRALLYEAAGAALAGSGRGAEALRYLGRASLLDPSPARLERQAAALVESSRPAEGLALLLRPPDAALPASALAIAGQAVDALGLPALQLELDRVRFSAVKGVAWRQGPLELPGGARLSTGAPLQFDSGLLLAYVADPGCRTCSRDLDLLARARLAGARLLMVPLEPDRDHALRQVLALYRHPWPVAVGKGVAEALGAREPGLVLVGRGGWSVAALPLPPGPELTAAIATLSRNDLPEAIPRSTWNRRSPERAVPAAPPGLDASGLAPGEGSPAPPEFQAASAALQAGKPQEALRLIEALAAREDGWLLPPEARLDRALCLQRLGRREEARQILLRIGDSRFQEAVDQALEAAPPGR